MKRLVLTLLVLFISVTLTNAEIITQDVEYNATDVALKGFLAYDDAINQKRPGVIVVHEWWGHNDHARNRAKMLAELGYTAFALDMYGDGKQAEHPDDAGAFAGMIRKDMKGAGHDRFMAALNVLRAHETVDRNNIAAIGYCFGGGTVLHMARFGVDLKGVVSFHGGLGTDTPAQAGEVKAKILVCHGADDKFISEEQIANFKAEMDEAGADYTFNSYEGATHSFTNPNADALSQKFGMPISYHKEADEKSWEDMKTFFKTIFSE